MDHRVINAEERWLRGQLKKKVLGLASLEHTIARKKSRIVWLQEGDANTAFFHLHASARQRRNHIFRLRRQGTTMTEPGEMCAVATDHFVVLLGTTIQRACVLNLDANLSTVGMTDLEVPF
jgi:hypothetical protein